MAVRGQRVSSSSTITSVSPTPVKTTGPPTVQIFETSGAQTLHSATARINFRWDRPVNGFVIGDTCVEFFDENDQTGFIDNFSGGENVSNYLADLHLPLNSEGNVDVTVIANAAADTADDTRIGPQTVVTVTFAYITTHLTVVQLEVTIDDPAQIPWRDANLPITFRWTEPVSRFTLA